MKADAETELMEISRKLSPKKRRDWLNYGRTLTTQTFFRSWTCPPELPGLPSIMALAVSSKNSVRASRSKLAGRDIQRRLEQIELATVSSLRALQMDIEGEVGAPSSAVLKKARAALR
jgi:hypothetical protein